MAGDGNSTHHSQWSLCGFSCFELEMLFLVSFVQFAGSAEEGLGNWLRPVIEAEWGLTDAESANLGTANQVVSVASNLLIGPAADRWGRRKVFIACIVNYVVFGAASAAAQTFTTYCCFRAGANLSVGVFILLFTVLAELMAPPNRATAMMLVAPFWSVGSAYSSALAPVLLPDDGPVHWRAYLLLQMAPLLVLLPWAYCRLAESPAWLRAHGRQESWGRGRSESLLRSAPLGRQDTLGTTKHNGGPSEIQESTKSCSSFTSAASVSSSSPRRSMWDDEDEDWVEDGSATMSTLEDLAAESVPSSATDVTANPVTIMLSLFSRKYRTFTVLIMFVNFTEWWGWGWTDWFITLGKRQGIGEQTMSTINLAADLATALAPFAAVFISRWISTPKLLVCGLCGMGVLNIAIAVGFVHGASLGVVGLLFCTYSAAGQMACAPLRVFMAAGFPVRYRATGMSMCQIAGANLAAVAAGQVNARLTSQVITFGLSLAVASFLAAAAAAAAATALSRRGNRDECKL
jgi:hypothetical protein